MYIKFAKENVGIIVFLFWHPSLQQRKEHSIHWRPPELEGDNNNREEDKYLLLLCPRTQSDPAQSEHDQESPHAPPQPPRPPAQHPGEDRQHRGQCGLQGRAAALPAQQDQGHLQPAAAKLLLTLRSVLTHSRPHTASTSSQERWGEPGRTRASLSQIWKIFLELHRGGNRWEEPCTHVTSHKQEYWIFSAEHLVL